MKVPAAVTKAARAALEKKASEVVVLDLRKQAGFTDFFVLASGANQKQILAIADAVTEAMRAEGLRGRSGSCSTTRASSSTCSRRRCACSTTSSVCGAEPSAWK